MRAGTRKNYGDVYYRSNFHHIYKGVVDTGYKGDSKEALDACKKAPEMLVEYYRAKPGYLHIGTDRDLPADDMEELNKPTKEDSVFG